MIYVNKSIPVPYVWCYYNNDPANGKKYGKLNLTQWVGKAATWVKIKMI